MRYGREIDKDGVCGPQTLGAIFDVLRESYEGWLNKHGLALADVAAIDIQYLVATPGLLTRPGFDGSPGTALDLFVGETEWMDADNVSAATIYQSKVVRVRPLRIPIEPGGWETGSYTVITDVTTGETIVPELYVLRSRDDRYEQQLLLPDNAVDTGLLELHFDGLPTDARFDFRVEVQGVGTYPLFEDLSYADLHRTAIGTQPPRKT